MAEDRVILINYTARKGAGPVCAYETARALCELGQPVAAVISQSVENYELWKALPLKKLVAIDTYDSMKSLAVKTLGFPFRQRRQIEEAFRDIKVDRILCPMDTLWTGFVNACFQGARVTVVSHDPISHSGANKIEAFLFDRHNRRADLLVVHSETFVDYMKEKYNKKVICYPLGELGRRYRECPNQIQLAEYDPKKTNFLFFGTISPYKGLDTLAEGYRKASEELGDRISLTVAGNGDFSPYEAAYEGLGNLSLFIKWIKDEEVDSLFSGRRIVLVCPYNDASQSGVIPVAFEYGIPCIASGTGGMAEQIEEGVDGLKIRPKDPAALAAAMRVMAEEPGLYERLAAGAAKKAGENTWKAAMKRWLEETGS